MPPNAYWIYKLQFCTRNLGAIIQLDVHFVGVDVAIRSAPAETRQASTVTPDTAQPRPPGASVIRCGARRSG